MRLHSRSGQPTRSPRHRQRRSWLLALAVALPATLPAQTAPLRLVVPAGRLDSALMELARQASLRLPDRPLPTDHRTRSLDLVAEPAVALEQLLRGTRYRAVIDGDRIVLERSATTGSQALATVQVVARDEAIAVRDRVERAQARSVRDLFAAEPAASISGGTRNGQRLFLRGMEGSNLNVSIDGARQGQNLYNHRGGLGNVDPEILRRVEIQPGPSAADQGFGALGGAVRFETADAQDRLAAGQRVSATARIVSTSADGGERLGGTLALRPVAQVGLLLAASGQRFDNLRIGGGDRVPFSGGNDEAVFGKLTLKPLPSHTVKVTIDRHRASGLNFMQRGDYPYQLQPSDLRARPPVHQQLARETMAGSWRFAPRSPWVDLESHVSRNANRFDAPASAGERFESTVHNYDLRNTVTLQRGALVTRTTLGVDRTFDRGTYNRDARPSASNVNDNTGLFLQHRLLTSRLSLSTGLRLDRFGMQFGPSVSRGSVLSPNATVEVRPVAPLAVHVGYGESTRGFGTVPIQFAGFLVPTPTFNGRVDGQLRAERARQWETGVKLRTDVGQARATRAEFSATAFSNTIRDAISFLQPGTGGLGNRRISDFFNEPTAYRLYGFDARARLSGVRGSSGLSFTQVRADRLPRLPQFVARTGAPVGPTLVWDSQFSPAPAWTMGATLTAVGRQGQTIAGDPAIFIARPGYSHVGTQLLWRPSWRGSPSIAVAIDNLFDRRFVSHTTFTQDGLATEEAGRNIRLSVGTRF